MLKKALILALILNISYMPLQSSSISKYSVGAISTGLGALCGWLAYKDLKKGWQAVKESNSHLNILKEMGAQVYKVTKTEFKWGKVEIKEHHTIDIPLTFSLDQKKKAKEHWDLFLAEKKHCDKMLDWSTLEAIASLLFFPIGIAVFMSGDL